jgi:molybdenum-dependent DNA-binding transcriptional regulator ModE
MPERAVSSKPEVVARSVIPAESRRVFELELKTNLDAGFHRHDEFSRRLKIVMDRFKTMDSFVTVATAGSFSAAAKQLGMSRALVSLHVTDLERRLGVRLLNRTTRCLTLTEAGASYLAFCQRTLAEMNEQESSLAQLQKEPRGSLKVTAPKSFGTLYLSDAVVGFSHSIRMSRRA